MTAALAVAAALALVSVEGPLPDRLAREKSADFALAGERAQLDPRYRRRPLGLDYNAAAPDHFYLWTVIRTWGQGVEYFYIDRRTGTVWGGYSCGPIHSPQLASLQLRFRRRFHIPSSKVREIEREGGPQEECRS